MKLVGRDAELAQLRDTCREASNGRGRVVVISGEPGLGKSALVEVIANEHPEFSITWGRAWELDDAPAYYPLWPCLKSLGVAFDGIGTDTSAFELWERVLEALVRAATNRPVMWIVEDLHVADLQSLDLLAFLAQAVKPLAVVLLVTTRPHDPRLADAAHKRIVRLVRAGVELRLGALPAPLVDELAKQWLGRELTNRELDQLTERTGGNPLFVIECARAGKQLLHTVPATVAVVVGERVDQLPAGARQLVQDAAILGNEVTAQVLAAMTSQLPARVIDDLAPALRAGIVEELAPGRFRFHHALVRDAIEARMTPGARHDAHGRAEAALATLPESPKIIVERARHALASVSPAMVDIVRRALVVLEDQGTYDRAAALSRQLLSALPGATSADYVHAARLALASGNYAQHRELALEAARIARGENAESFARAALMLGAELQPGVVDGVIVQHLEEALAALSPGPSHCRVSVRLAAALQPAKQPQVPIGMARAAIADARSVGDPALLEEVMFVGCSAMTEYVDASEMLELNREHLALARDRGDLERMLRAYTRVLFNEIELGHFDDFDAHLDEMLRIASAVGHPRLTWRPLLLASMRAVARGQVADSDRYLAEVDRAVQLTDDPVLAMSINAHKQQRALELGQEEAVQAGLAMLDRSVATLPARLFIMPLIRGLAAARFGDVEAGHRACEQLPFGELLARVGTANQLGIAGEVCAFAGTTEQREQILARLESVPDRHIMFGHTPMIYSGPVRRVLGLLEISLGRRAEGERLLRRALETCRTARLATWVERIEVELGDHAAVVPVTVSKAALSITREGELWRITYGARVARVPDSRGMELIAKLVERPGEDMHVLVLAGSGGDALVESDAGEALDGRAAKSYRDRIAAIDKLPSTKALTAERAFLQSELARAFGLGNTARKMGSMSERARVNVQRRIKDSLAKLEAHDPVIGEYLRASIRTGTYCMFRP